MTDANEQLVWRKVERRIVPLLFVLWLVNFLDRVNVSFAAIDMSSDLGLDPATYGFGAGIFFIGYILFEMPSNMMLRRFGARVWLTRIIVTWGLVSLLQAFVVGPKSFVLVRFLLGVAEAGFLPGMLYYLMQWFPSRHRAQVIGKIMAANMLAMVVGAPLSAAILGMHGLFGLAGWQMIFLIEGVPAILLGGVAYAVLSDEPKDATWLDEEERGWLQAQMAADRAVASRHGVEDFGAAVRQPIVWLLGCLYFMVGMGFFGVTMWLPQILKQMYGGSATTIGLLSAIPYLLGAIAMVVNGRHSDATLERRWHLAMPLAIAATGLLAGAFADGLAAYLLVAVAIIGIGAVLSVFWSIPSAFLTGPAAAAGLALVNMISGVSGFVSPFMVGLIRGRSSDFGPVLVFMAVCLGASALLGVILPFRAVTSGSGEALSQAA